LDFLKGSPQPRHFYSVQNFFHIGVLPCRVETLGPFNVVFKFNRWNLAI